MPTIKLSATYFTYILYALNNFIFMFQISAEGDGHLASDQPASILMKLLDEIEIFKTQQNDILRAKSFDDLLDNSNFYESIRQLVDRSPAEVLLMILKYSIKNKLCLTAMSELIMLINRLFPEPVLPESRYIIDKLFNPKSEVEYHITCPKCCLYIGNLQNIKTSTKCRNFNYNINITHPSNMNFFVIINPSHEIGYHLTKHADYYHYVLHERVSEEGHIQDIYDGQYYKNFVRQLPDIYKLQYVTAVLNTDGAPKFKCSQYALWPIYLMPNEVPPQEIFNSIVACGLWFGEKPDLRIFIDPFIDMINCESKNNIEIEVKGQHRSIRLFPILVCVDTIARAPLQGTVQFNGKYGCNWCLHPGEYFAKSMRYPILHYHPELRTSQNTITQMNEVREAKRPIFGIKQVSPLVNLPNFDIINGFVPDYMHFYVYGVVAQISEYTISSLSKEDIIHIDDMLVNMKVPNQLRRLTKGIKHRNDWKALEWENWALYYSIPIFSIYMRENKLKHWIILVESLYILLQMDITHEEIIKVDEMLYIFVANVEKFYTKAAMTYNIHQLLHVIQSVVDWGPLWAHSSYCFESANYVLLTAIKCAKGVKQQIIRFINIHYITRILEEKVIPISSYIVKEYCEEITTVRVRNTIKY